MDRIRNYLNALGPSVIAKFGLNNVSGHPGLAVRTIVSSITSHFFCSSVFRKVKITS